MLTPRGNLHNHQLPDPGEIGTIVGLANHGINPWRKCIVESYPVCDNVWPWSHGIHTCVVRFLDNGERRALSGFYFRAVDWAGFPDVDERKPRPSPSYLVEYRPTPDADWRPIYMAERRARAREYARSLHKVETRVTRAA